MPNFSSSCSPYLVSSTICVALGGAVRREKYGSRKINIKILELLCFLVYLDFYISQSFPSDLYSIGLQLIYEALGLLSGRLG